MTKGQSLSQPPITTTTQPLNHPPDSPQRPSKLAKTYHSDDGDEEIQLSPKAMNPRIQRYLVAIEYIGTRFSGAQQQATGRTVVGVLEEAFRKFIGQPVSIFCSSRTDAGVHALSNVCHVDVERISKRKPDEALPPHEPSVVKRAVNHFLQKTEELRNGRRYFYRLLSGKEPISTFEKDRAWHVAEYLNLLAMQRACQVLIGRHDFSSFRAAACQAKSPIRTLDELTVTEMTSSPYFPPVAESEQNNASMESAFLTTNEQETDSPVISDTNDTCKIGNFVGEISQVFGRRKKHRCLVVTARSRSFLYHQVRLIVGVLKSVGTGDLTVSDVERILKAKNVAAASPMAPACGLYLGHVKYDLPSDT